MKSGTLLFCQLVTLTALLAAALTDPHEGLVNIIPETWKLREELGGLAWLSLSDLHYYRPFANLHALALLPAYFLIAGASYALMSTRLRIRPYAYCVMVLSYYVTALAIMPLLVVGDVALLQYPPVYVGIGVLSAGLAYAVCIRLHLILVTGEKAAGRRSHLLLLLLGVLVLVVLLTPWQRLELYRMSPQQRQEIAFSICPEDFTKLVGFIETCFDLKADADYTGLSPSPKHRVYGGKSYGGDSYAGCDYFGISFEVLTRGTPLHAAVFHVNGSSGHLTIQQADSDAPEYDDRSEHSASTGNDGRNCKGKLLSWPEYRGWKPYTKR